MVAVARWRVEYKFGDFHYLGSRSLFGDWWLCACNWCCGRGSVGSVGQSSSVKYRNAYGWSFSCMYMLVTLFQGNYIYMFTVPLIFFIFWPARVNSIQGIRMELWGPPNRRRELQLRKIVLPIFEGFRTWNIQWRFLSAYYGRVLCMSEAAKYFSPGVLYCLD